jgi:class 3 adenylate cyclase
MAGKPQEKKSRMFRDVHYRFLSYFMQLFRISSYIVIAIFLLPVAAPFIRNIHKFEYIMTGLKIERAISSFVKGIIPTVVSGHDVTRWIVIVAAVLLGVFFNNLRERFKSKAARMKIMKEYEEWKSEKQLSEDSTLMAPLKERIENLQTSDRKEREELLRLFAETKKKLDDMGRDLAFLSIDVVDSTGLKVGEEKAVIEYDFKEFKNFVEHLLDAKGKLKSTWTPDGVMCCFSTVDAAVDAARTVIDGLDSFNREVKTMKRDFVIRCGINAGYVYFDESMPLEEMSDRAIDIAGHMQKHAPPNSICIAKPAIEPLEDRTGFVQTTKIVDGYEVYMSERRKAPR